MPLPSYVLSLLRSLPQPAAARVLASLSNDELTALGGSWRHGLARPEQRAPGTDGAAIDRTDWTFWLLLAGRGFGKTRSGAEWIIDQAVKRPGSHLALVAATTDDARKTMLSSGLESNEGASGILAVSPPDFRPVYEPSKRIVTWPNGTVGTVYSADEPDRLRGPQHHAAWVDEIAAWSRQREAWDMLLFGLRLGRNPQACITTTPRPVPLIRDLLANPQTVVTRGTTYDNRANLAEAFFANVIRRYEGTRLGRQELGGELLEDHPGALWRLGQIDALRVIEAPDLRRIVVAIDPAVTSNPDSAETGMVVAGVGPCCCNGRPELHGFVLADSSGRYTPNEWAQEAVARYKHHHADRIVGEVNNGGDLVEANVRSASKRVSYKAVRASRGKQTRAEPVAALYERGVVHHVGSFPLLEDQLCTWDPSAGMPSPDRLDALVWALTELMLGGSAGQPATGLSLPDLSQTNPWSS